ncbi:glycosyltransferase family 4 protein [Moraxellaceae bacterium AER2_44_116]|nr:glycosyltransferase [Moraxellaceae bacterium]TQC97705.1 glycosyltransferase family 4 protein [Moraxellaceae bacterium AER2_44_116]
MRIVFQYFTGGGGALSNIMLLLQTLSKLYPQDSIIVVCSNKSDLHHLNVFSNIEVISYDAGDLHQEIDRLMLGYVGLKKIASQYKADIVWSLNIGSYVKLDVPHVLSVNNPYQVYPLEDVVQYHPKSRFNLLVLRSFFKKSLCLSDAVIVQTPIMGRYIGQIKDAPTTYVVPKAVERDEDVRVDPLPEEMKSILENRKGFFTFLYVSTSSPHKNHKTLIDAFELLANQVVGARVVLTISHDELIKIGGGKAQKLVDDGYVIPIGWVKKQHLRSLYDAVDACLMPSVLESLSSAHLEAMEWGKAQIVADLPYARDLCGGAAVYVAPEFPSKWAETIMEFIPDDTLRQNLVMRGREQMQLFPKTWDEMARQIHKVFEGLIAKT